MTTYFDVPRETYWLVFSQGTHFISRWLKRDFSHISLLTKDNYNWLRLNPTRSRLVWEILPDPIAHDVPHEIAQKYTVIRIDFYDRSTGKLYGWGGLFNCVTWTKYILGVPIFALTPFRLYKRLLNFNQSQKNQLGIASIKRI